MPFTTSLLRLDQGERGDLCENDAVRIGSTKGRGAIYVITTCLKTALLRRNEMFQMFLEILAPIGPFVSIFVSICVRIPILVIR